MPPFYFKLNCKHYSKLVHFILIYYVDKNIWGQSVYSWQIVWLTVENKDLTPFPSILRNGICLFIQFSDYALISLKN